MLNIVFTMFKKFKNVENKFLTQILVKKHKIVLKLYSIIIILR